MTGLYAADDKKAEASIHPRPIDARLDALRVPLVGGRASVGRLALSRPSPARATALAISGLKGSRSGGDGDGLVGLGEDGGADGSTGASG